MTKLHELELRLRDEPDNLGLRVMLAGAFDEAGRRDDAIELYRSVAVAYREQGRPQQAIAVCRSILAIAPDDASCRALLGLLLAPPPGAPLVAAPSREHRPTPPPLGPPPEVVARPTPPPLAPPPEVEPLPAPPASAQPALAAWPALPPLTSPGERAAGPAARPSPDDVTPLPAPLPYHVADPTVASIPILSAADLPASLREELATYPEIAGIANAARQISASLIAERGPDDDDDGEPDTAADDVPRDRATLRRISSGQLDTMNEPPPLDLGPAQEPGDDDPTIPPAEIPGSRVRVIDHDKTPARQRRDRSRPPSIAPPSTATGPLTSALFAPVPPQNRAAVLLRFRRRMVALGTTVVRSGETGHGLLLVVRGRLDLHGQRSDGARISLGAIGVGDHHGEVSLLARARSTIEVIAAVDSELLVLGAADFYEVIAAFPALRAELESVAERRARDHAARLLR